MHTIDEIHHISTTPPASHSLLSFSCVLACFLAPSTFFGAGCRSFSNNPLSFRPSLTLPPLSPFIPSLRRCRPSSMENLQERPSTRARCGLPKSFPGGWAVVCNWEVSRFLGSGGNNCMTPHDVGCGRALPVLGVGGHPAHGENFTSREFSPLISLE